MTDQEIVNRYYDLKIRSWELEQATQELKEDVDEFWKSTIGSRALEVVDEFGAPYVFDGFNMEVVRVYRREV